MSSYPGPEAETPFERLRDPEGVANGFATVLEEEGLPVACARGAYFSERWAVLICHNVDPRDVRACLRRAIRERDLPAAVCSTADLVSPQAVRALFTGGQRFVSG